VANLPVPNSRVTTHQGRSSVTVRPHAQHGTRHVYHANEHALETPYTEQRLSKTNKSTRYMPTGSHAFSRPVCLCLRRFDEHETLNARRSGSARRLPGPRTEHAAIPTPHHVYILGDNKWFRFVDGTTRRMNETGDGSVFRHVRVIYRPPTGQRSTGVWADDGHVPPFGAETAPGCAAGNAVLGPPSSRNGHAIIVHLIRRKFYLAAFIHFDSRGRQIGNHGFGNCFSSKPVKGETSLSNVPAKMSPRIEGKTLFR
jgi:hypothetical protein